MTSTKDYSIAKELIRESSFDISYKIDITYMYCYIPNHT